jgi:transcriptional regulator
MPTDTSPPASPFAPREPDDVAGLIRRAVLGLVTTHDSAGFASTPLPLLAELDREGRVSAIVGHFARSNPHVARAQATPQALISFLGAHGYVSPLVVSNPTWAPTWNYELAQFEVEIDFQPEQGDAAIRALVEAMEGREPGAWSVDRIGDRYEPMVARVIAFRARVVRQSARFKLGQDEDPRTFREIVRALGDSPLATAMVEQAGDADRR